MSQSASLLFRIFAKIITSHFSEANLTSLSNKMLLLFLGVLLECTVNSLLLHFLLVLVKKLASVHVHLPKTYYITRVFNTNFSKFGEADARAFSVSTGKACFKIRVLSNKICPHIVHWNIRFKISFPCSRSSVV